MRSTKRKTPADEGSGGAKWLTTFNDLMTLLMVFFVLLFTMGSVDTKKLNDFQGSLQSGLGILEAGNMASVKVATQEPKKTKEIRDGEKEGATDAVDKYMKGLDSEKGIDAVGTREGIVITLKDTILFRSGRADINPAAFSVLNRIISVISRDSNPVRIKGHTDNDPIRGGRFPSNWELSTARAVNILKYFADTGKISPERLSAAGYGEIRPIVPNNTPQHKSRNRRVEIIIMMEEEK